VKLSRAYIPTQKEIPADAVIPSHILMLRAGLIRPLAAGVYSYLPLGWRAMRKAMAIIREEMDRIGAQEIQLPVLNPVEIWNETGRNSDFGEGMFRLKDRKNRTLVLAPTHEEVVCDLARNFVKSYKDLPQIWYQIQTKFRDEPRPRSGVIRTRQFIMKDSYTLDADQEGLDKAYELHAQAYRNIFTRCRLKFLVVGASSGLMGGSASQEFMIESQYGEDTLVLCNHCDYAANLEIATSSPLEVNEKVNSLQKIHTPNKKTIAEVSTFLKKKPAQFMKSLLYISNNEPIMVLIRGDHSVNETKLQSYVGTQIRPANPQEVIEICGTEIGFVGPIGLKKKVRLIADTTLKNQHNLITGANEKDYHLSGVELNRDVKNMEYADIRTVLSGEKCSICGGDLRVVNAIELGHIFKLGTKYSERMNATYLDNKGQKRPILMGSYGIGVERVIATAIEQNHDEKGIVWDPVLAPYLVHIIPVNNDDEEIFDAANRLYNMLQQEKIDTLIDDRDVSPGYKFKDADLLGMPLQIIIGEKWRKKHEIEIKERKSGNIVFSSEKNLIATIRSLLESL